MKNYISKRLYIEGLTRVRAPGILAAALTFIFSVNTPLTGLVSYWFSQSAAEAVPELLPTSQVLSPLIILLIMAPFFAMTSFHFLNQRHSSDFYHALPYTRKSIFISFLLGILTWIFATALLCTTVRAVLFALHPDYVVHFGYAYLGMLSYLVGCMVLLGYMLLALSLTGTRLSNVAVFLILVTTIRTVTGNYVSTLQELVPIIDVNGYPYTLFSWKYFLPTSLFGGLHILRSGNDLLLNPYMIVYHALLAVGLFLLSALAFVRRPSPTAGMPATSRFAQHIWRLLVALPLALMSASYFAQAINIKGGAGTATDIRSEVALLGLIMLVASLVVYFMYELISTGKWRRMHIVARNFLFILIPMVLFIGGVKIGEYVLCNDTIEKEDIASVSFGDIGVAYYQTTWETLQTDGIPFTDPQLIAIVQNAYASSLKAVKNGSLFSNPGIPYSELKTTIAQKNGRTRSYSLAISREAYNKLSEQIFTEPQYRDAYLSMPSAEDITYVFAGEMQNEDAQLPLFRTFLEEYGTLSPEQKKAVKDETNELNAVFTFQVNGVYKGRSFYSEYSVPATMEQTVLAYRNAINNTRFRDSEDSHETHLEVTRSMMQRYLDGTLTDDALQDIQVRLFADGEQYDCYIGKTDPSHEAEMDAIRKRTAELITAEGGVTSTTKFAVIRLMVRPEQGYPAYVTVSVDADDELIEMAKPFASPTHTWYYE